MANPLEEIKRTDNGVDNLAENQEDDKNVHSVVINVQPQAQNTRAELPVTTTSWRSLSTRGQFIPTHGLDFLIGVSSLQIYQTVEFNALTSKIESENRYVVRMPSGDGLYLGNEVSTSSQRCFCGSARAFSMHLYDSTRQEAMVLHRRLASSSCCFPCRLQLMIVMTPPGEYVGCVQQRWTMIVPLYAVLDANDNALFVIEGPAVVRKSASMLSEFKILSADALRAVGKITHEWNRELVNYVTTLTVSEEVAQPKHKALLLAAAFLMEYTYFDAARFKIKCNCC